ncbi:LARGE xylosyl- and glucuronyltransferase 2 [Geodia barretti]|uniref:LARGE xylosyl- and glucuronyltransferase 2 n=1 Tax=Geodia barretti TaxID=519541 RepID=A0AA35SE90_GEOBA|nr:LARGE xylosyl- and glucuronyltransferase 2 [Geodia barretti]
MLQQREMYRQRGLFYLCSLCLLVVVPVLYLATPSSPGYSESTHTGEWRFSRRKHFHRAGEARNCEIVDVAISIGGQESCNRAALLIKSILLFRQSPIRLHLLVDPPSRHVMGTLLRTWHLYGLEFHLYTVKWTSKQSQKGYESLVYLMESLPPSVERVISLQSHLLLSVDIHHVWKTFVEMEKVGSVFGLVEALSLPGQFRDELMLIDLAGFRRKGWPQFRGEGLSGSITVESVSKALHILYEQDLTLFYVLSPGWGTEQQDTLIHVATEPCFEQQTVCVHSLVVASDFKTKIQEYDGNLLRDKWIDCRTGPTFDQNAIDYREKTTVYAPPCTDFKREGNQERRTHPFYAGQWFDPNSVDSNDITLSVHGSLDRLVFMLEPMCRHWTGPMSIAVVANDTGVSNLLNTINSSPIISSRKNIAYHVVYKEGIYYPNNMLRLTALSNVGTNSVFMDDMDFIPSFGLYSYLRKTVREFDLTHTVLVIPAFETKEDRDTFTFPEDKAALLEMESQGRVFQFHKDGYIRGHAPTDYALWRKAKEPYEIQWQPLYEPYLVGNRNITPFDTRFVGRGFNKVSHIEHLYYDRYKFIVLPGGFLIHLPHQISSDAQKESESDRHRECYTRRWNEWRAEKAEKYGYEPYLMDVYKIWNGLSSPYETSF